MRRYTSSSAFGVALNKTCYNDTNCTGTPNSSTCVDTDGKNGPDTCVCSTGFSPNAQNTSCIAHGYLNGACASHADCVGSAHAGTCTSGTCECDVGYAVKTGRSTCEIAVGYLEGGCAYNTSCTYTENADMCVDHKCKCNPGYTARAGNTSCVADGALGGVCADHANCTKTAKAGICMCGKCVCNPGYTVNAHETECNAGGVAMASAWIVLLTVMFEIFTTL
ncbi:tenascin-like [Dreissena polymorpha]|uniref:tenascin-like n=1 Tax=Dreissena polymorpha TaxID=45954 RepID=UPI002264BD8C|nr:tenascin-like [Dreissena polymorpha]